MRDLGVPSQVTVQGDAKVTLYLTGLDGTAVNLVAKYYYQKNMILILSVAVHGVPKNILNFMYFFDDNIFV